VLSDRRRKKACLVDTGTGAGNLKAFVESITDLPLTVVVSHAHMDHCGGAGLFDMVYMREGDKPCLKKHGSQTFRAEFFTEHLGGEFKPDDFLPVPEDVFVDVPEYTVWDLGGVSVELLPFTGHTPGMICPFIREDRALIIGDACDDHVLLCDEYSSTVSEYLCNLQKILEKKDEYDRLYGNHGNYEYSMELMENVKESCNMILAKKDAHLFIHIMGQDLYTANALDENDMRIDGKRGNVLYKEDKAQ